MSDLMPPRTDPQPDGEGEVTPETRAKQGRGGRHVLVIGVVSFLLVAIGFAILYFSFAPGMQRAETRTEAATTSPEASQPLPERPTTTLPTEAPPAEPEPVSTSPGN